MTAPQEELLDRQVAELLAPGSEDGALARAFGAFHWEYEFPDAFAETEWGFDLVVMNPPWEAVMPEDDDFFSSYYPGFRRMRSKPEKRKVMAKLLADPQTETPIQDTWRNPAAHQILSISRIHCGAAAILIFGSCSWSGE